MWSFHELPRYPLPDVARFVEVVNAHDSFFAPDQPLVVARAPGRLDLMGGIADYSGALVMELPLAVATFVAAQPMPEPLLTVFSTTAADIGAEPLVSLSLQVLSPPDRPLTYSDAHALLSADPMNSWVAYVAGTLVVLHREKGITFEKGLRLLIHSDVPVGKGVSSSAALEVAAMQAVCGVCDVELDGREMALLCQKVENLVVGAPCGVMDQMTAACGEQNHLLALLCQPAELQASVPLPPDIEVWGIDSGIRHAVSGADYSSVRIGAFMGYRIIAEQAGLPVTLLSGGGILIDDPMWHGCLASIPPSLWMTAYCRHVPLTINGAAFLQHYGGSTDAVTHINPACTYAVRQPTAHPIYEHHRVRLFRALLQNQPLSEEHLFLLGELMYQSHESYSACGLGSDGTDRLVELARLAGPATGFHGAKITGGGSGGTVAVLARRGRRTEIERIAAEYERETGRHALILGGSSPGAMQFGVMRLVYCQG